jgi:hypothetical protein
MFPIPFYYIWTPKYELFHIILKDCLSKYKDVFDPRPIYMTQEEFDASIQKGAGGFTSWFEKINRILEILNTLPESTYFIFADADLYMFPNKKIKQLLEIYVESNVDFVAMRESNNQRIANFGFVLLKVCEQNRNLFTKTVTIDKIQPGLSDQSLLNISLKSYTGTHGFFPPVFVTTSSTCVEIIENQNNIYAMKSQIMIHQPIPSGEIPGDEKILRKIYEYIEFGIDLTPYAEKFPILTINGIKYLIQP